jgi:hypothetical protein
VGRLRDSPTNLLWAMALHARPPAQLFREISTKPVPSRDFTLFCLLARSSSPRCAMPKPINVCAKHFAFQELRPICRRVITKPGEFNEICTFSVSKLTFRYFRYFSTPTTNSTA